MGRKKMTTTERNPIEAATMTKTDAVKEALAQGLKKNPEIAEYAKTKYGIEIETNYVSIIKSKLKKVGGKKSTGTRGGRTPVDHPDGNGTLPVSVKALVQLVGKDEAKKILLAMVG